MISMLYRKNYIQKIVGFADLDVIKVITGIRRCGKSTIMKQVQEHFKQQGIRNEQILYYNFESFEHIDLLEATALYKEIKNRIKNNKSRSYLFCDEIQNVHHWQQCVNSLQVDFDCDIYLTGSNANLLSGELATHIAGRFVEIKVLPFSFQEYIASQADQNIEKTISEMFQEYIIYGGMPFVCYLEDKSKFAEYMNGVFSTVVLNDMIARNALRSPDVMTRILYYAIDNIGHTFSATSIVKYLKNEHIKVSVDTVINYLGMANTALLLQKVRRKNLIGKEILKTQEKYYISDHGFKEYLFSSNIRDIELVLENIIYLEMLRRGYQVFVGNVEQKEIDFVCEKSGKVIYLQVSYLMPDRSTRERELAPLLCIKDNFPKYILSLDEINFSESGIQHQNIRDFLLNNEV